LATSFAALPLDRFANTGELYNELVQAQDLSCIFKHRNLLIAAGGCIAGGVTNSLNKPDVLPGLKDLHYLAPPDGDFVCIFRLSVPIRSPYLPSFTNAVMLSEEGLGEAQRWMPAFADLEGELIYRFDVHFDIGAVELNIRTHVFT